MSLTRLIRTALVIVLLCPFSAWAAESDTTGCSDGVALEDSSNYTSVVTSSLEGVMHGALFTAAQTAQLKSIIVHHVATGTNSARLIKCAIYKESDKSLVDETEERSYTTTTSLRGWHNYVFPATPATITAGTLYSIIVWANSSGGTVSIRFGQQTGKDREGHIENNQAYAAWPATRDADNFDQFTDTTASIRVFYECPTGSGRRHRDHTSHWKPHIYWPVRTFAGGWHDEIPE